MTESKKIERMEKRKKLLEHRAEEVDKLNSDVRERLIALINNEVIHTGRYEYLEHRYGIAARKWKNVCNKVQLPGIDMLCSVLKDYPFFAEWLMLGKAKNTMQLDPTIEGWENILYKNLTRFAEKNTPSPSSGDDIQGSNP